MGRKRPRPKQVEKPPRLRMLVQVVAVQGLEVAHPVRRAARRLGDAGPPRGDDPGPASAQQPCRAVLQPGVQRCSRIPRLHGDFGLRQDRAGVHLSLHDVQRDAGRRLVDDRPDVRVNAPAPWQQRRVEIDRAPPRGVEHLSIDDVSEIDGQEPRPLTPAKQAEEPLANARRPRTDRDPGVPAIGAEQVPGSLLRSGVEDDELGEILPRLHGFEEA